jgi:membrane protein DedA with SNARE-associated domain/membrane-associated phospholipid phosphatase
MDSGWTQELLNWVSAHPGWTGVLVFLVACVESLVVIGILIPGIVLLFGVGAMIGMGVIELGPIWAWGSAGALLGDLFSYAVGHRYREQLVEIWPFSRYPSMLKRGSAFFQKHGAKSVIAGRFIGPLRPVIPATAGMLGMTPGRFISVDIPACILWSPGYLLPGMLFGASLEVATEYAGRLSLVLIILFIALWLTWWLIWAMYEFLIHRSAQWLRSAVSWSRRHPLLGRLSGPLLDPAQPEALAVSLLGILLVVTFWSLALLLFFSPFTVRPEAIDQAVMSQALALRNHIADPVMVAITQMSRWWVLLPAPAAVLLWLLGAGRTSAAIHWVVAMAGGVLLTLLLGWTLRSTPLLHSTGVDEFYIPSSALTLCTVVLGFFSVMVAGELRERHRKWSYMASALLLTLLLLARVYLGLDWLSGALVGILLGFTWTAIVGTAYRLRTSQSFSGTIASVIFFGTLLITMVWQIDQRVSRDLDQLRLELPRQFMEESDWWNSGWASLPRERTHFESVAARAFNAQLALPLPQITSTLHANGWETSPDATWQWTMLALNPAPDTDSLPLLSKDYLGHAEVLKLRHKGHRSDRQLTVRIWDSGTRLSPGQQPLYLVQVSEEVLRSRLVFFSYWRALPVKPDGLEKLVSDLSVYESREVAEGLLLFRRVGFIESGAESAIDAGDAPPDR